MRTNISKQTRRLIILIMLLFGLFACRFISPKEPSVSQANELYQQLLNMPVPSEISQLEITADSAEAGLWTAVYFRYTAPPEYFKSLSRHPDFPQISEFNTSISPVSCTSFQMPDDFSYWTDQQIVREGKQCYTGVYFPYVHYLIYSPETKKVHHFVAGMSG